MSTRIDVRLDASGALADVACTVAAQVFIPAAVPKAVLFCTPGGSYDRSYWDLEVPGRSGYSFARFAVHEGYAVVVVDNLGTGESTRPVDGNALTLEVIANANARARRAAVAHVPGGSDVAWIGIGHSMGGALTVAQQSAWPSFDALAILGTSFLSGSSDVDIDAQMAAVAELLAATHVEDGPGYLRPDRDILRPMFHASDVPDDVIAAEAPHAVVLPIRSAVRTAIGLSLRPLAAGVDVPVFLAFGEASDISPQPRAEPAAFAAAPDITLHLVPGSAHCHNASGQRTLLWERLLRWVAAIVDVNA